MVLTRCLCAFFRSPATPRRAYSAVVADGHEGWKSALLCRGFCMPPKGPCRRVGGHPLIPPWLHSLPLHRRVRLVLPRKTCYHHARENRAVERATYCGVE
jgi:hypothetical protein